MTPLILAFGLAAFAGGYAMAAIIYNAPRRVRVPVAQPATTDERAALAVAR